MVKMVVFDLDGTLVNSLVDLGIATNEGLKQAGLPVQSFCRQRQRNACKACNG